MTAILDRAEEEETAQHDAPGRRNNMLRRLPIGVRLRQLREETGMAPSELHRQTVRLDPTGRGVSTVTICRLEAGTQTARVETVKLIADVLSKALKRRIRVDDLYTGGSLQLTAYVERERKRRGASPSDFAATLGLTASRYDAIIRGLSWHPVDLPGVLRALPESYPLVVGALSEHGSTAVQTAE